MKEQVSLTAASMGIPYFASTTASYSIDVTLARQINNMVAQNVITSTYQENYSGEMGYFLDSSLASSNTTATMTLQMVGNSQMVLLKFTLILLTAQLQTTNTYVSLF